VSEYMELLLVDNEPDQIEIRHKWLEESNYKVSIATTLYGAWCFIEAYHQEHEGKSPLVLLDIMMPITNDLDWLESSEVEKISSPIAGLVFAEKLQKKYPDILVAWHSVRDQLEPPVKDYVDMLGFKIIQKDLQSRTEFIKEVNECFFDGRKV